MTIQLENISKSFGNTRALDGVNVSFGQQKIYGLLGNNGAGKSTMLNIITSRLIADSGTLTLDGSPIQDNDQALGQIYMLGEKNYYPETMKVKEAFKWGKIFYPNFDSILAEKLAKQFNLPLKKKITELSTGYASIFRIVMAFSTNAPFLLLDEPILGLDAGNRDVFYKLLLERYSENPCTIVVSTHLIAEVQNIIEHCVIINDGRILKDAPCEELLRSGYSVSGPVGMLSDYIRGKDVLSVNNLGGLGTACLGGEMPDASDLPAGLEAGKLGLQEYFIQLVNTQPHSKED